MKKSNVRWLYVALILVIMAVSCAAFAKDEKVTLTYWNGFTGPDRPALEALVDRFNKSNAKIEIKMDIMPWDSFYQKLASALATGQGPDLLAFATERIGTYAKPGAIVPINDFYKGKNGFDPAILPKALNANLKFNGKYYGAPMNFATLLLYYNKDLFKAAGLDPEKPPKNWTELKDYAIKLTKVSGGKVEQYGFGIASRETVPMWPILIWGNGGDFINYRAKTSLINNANTVKAVQYFADLISKNRISPAILTGAEVDKLFESQKAAMYMCGPWAVNGFKKAGLNFGVAPVPAGPKKAVTLGTGVAMCLTSSSKHKKEAYEFFKYWNTKESQVYWALNTGFPPTRTDLLDDPALKANPYVIAFSAVANQSQFYLQQLTNFGRIDSDVITPAMENILLGKMTVKESLDKAAADMNAMLKE